MDVSAELKEWAKSFLTSRDVFQKNILEIKDLDGDFVVHKRTGDVVFLIRPVFKSVDELLIPQGVNLVVLNTRQNLKSVVDNWAALAKIESLCIYFVNPRANQKWLLYPFTHDRIADRSSLKRGLDSLFSMVEPYN